MAIPSLIATIESVNAYAKSKGFPALNALQQGNASLMYDIATRAGLDPAMAIGQMYLETRLKPYNATNSAGARGASQFLKGTAEQYGVDWNLLGKDIKYDYEAYAKLMQAEVANGKVKNAYDAGVLYHAGPGGLATGKGVGKLTKAYASGVEAISRGANGVRDFSIPIAPTPTMVAEAKGPAPLNPSGISVASSVVPDFSPNSVMAYEKAKSAYAQDAVAAYKAEDRQQFGALDPIRSPDAQLIRFDTPDPLRDQIASRLSEIWDAEPFYKDDRKLSENV